MTQIFLIVFCHLRRLVITDRAFHGFAFPDASGKFSDALQLDGLYLPDALDAHQLRKRQMQKSQNSFSGTSKLQDPGCQLQYALLRTTGPEDHSKKLCIA